MLRPVLDAHQGTFLTAQIADVRVLARPSDLSAIVGALLDNARLHADGAIVELHTSQEGRTVALEVRDFGPGVHPSEVSSVFERGRRGVRSVRDEIPGSGLGLYLARQRARAMGGDLTMHLPRGGGAAFVLTVAVAVTSRRCGVAHRTPGLAALARFITGPRIRGSLTGRDLWRRAVASSADHRGSLADGREPGDRAGRRGRLGHGRAPATSVDAVLAMASELRPDVVLLDLDLGPQLGSGIELVPELRSLDARIVIVSGTTSRLDLAAAVEAGAAGIVGKSQPVGELVAAVQAVADGRTILTLSQRDALLRELQASRAARAFELERFQRLTPREQEVLRGLMKGLRVRDLARAASLSQATVRTQIRGVLTKLGVRSQLEAVAQARTAGWPPR